MEPEATKLRLSLRVRFGLWIERLVLLIQGATSQTWPQEIDSQDGHLLISDIQLSDAEAAKIKSRWLELYSNRNDIMVLSGKFRIIPIKRTGGERGILGYPGKR